MSRECFGFEPDVEYDAMVVAPGWKPTKIIREESYRVTQLTQHSYFSGYLVEKDGLKIAWAQTASGACNLLDHCIIFGELQFKTFFSYLLTKNWKCEGIVLYLSRKETEATHHAFKIVRNDILNIHATTIANARYEWRYL